MKKSKWIATGLSLLTLTLLGIEAQGSPGGPIAVVPAPESLLFADRALVDLLSLIHI